MPTGIAVSPDGSTLWVADTLNNRIQSLSLTAGTWGTPIHKTTGTGKQTAFHRPLGGRGGARRQHLGLRHRQQPAGLDEHRGRPQLERRPAPRSGVPDNTAGNQTIYPFAVAFGSGDDVYLSDTWNNRVLVLTS